MDSFLIAVWHQQLPTVSPSWNTLKLFVLSISHCFVRYWFSKHWMIASVDCLITECCWGSVCSYLATFFRFLDDPPARRVKMCARQFLLLIRYSAGWNASRIRLRFVKLIVLHTHRAYVIFEERAAGICVRVLSTGLSLLLLSVSSIHHLSEHLPLSLFEYSGSVLISRCTAGHTLCASLLRTSHLHGDYYNYNLTGSPIIHDLSRFVSTFFSLSLFFWFKKKNLIAPSSKCKKRMLVYHNVPHAERQKSETTSVGSFVYGLFRHCSSIPRYENLFLNVAAAASVYIFFPATKASVGKTLS